MRTFGGMELLEQLVFGFLSDAYAIIGNRHRERAAFHAT
jgi:hypothetical protein